MEIADLAGMRLAIHPKTRVTASVMKNPDVLKAYVSSASLPSMSLPKNSAARRLSG